MVQNSQVFSNFFSKKIFDFILRTVGTFRAALYEILRALIYEQSGFNSKIRSICDSVTLK